MKEIFCNVSEPDLFKIAAVTGNKLSGIFRSLNVTYVKLNGELMPASQARARMLEGVTLVTHGGVKCKV